PGEVRLPTQEFAQQSQPALAIPLDQGPTPLREQHAVDVLVEAGPARVARLDPQTALEGPCIVAGQHEPIRLLEQEVFKVLELLDGRPLDPEVPDLAGAP